MATLVADRIERPAILFGEPTADGGHGDLGGGPMLDELIAGTWEALAARAVVACPMCGGAMRPRPGSGAAAAGGRCGGCGTTLA